MKKSLLLATLTTPFLTNSTATFAKKVVEKKSPNIVFIFADDHCYDCVGAVSKTNGVLTPNLDKLISRGTLFTHAFNQGAWNGAVSAASRAMLATGVNVWKAQNKLKSKDTKYWSERMSEAGYDTYMTGKWHVNGVSVPNVFDTVRNVRGGMPKQSPDCYGREFIYSTPDKWTSYDRSYGGHFEGGVHWAEIVKSDAVDYINMAKKSDKPFFMYLAFNSPHDPRQAPKMFFDLYKTDSIVKPASFLPVYPYADEIGCSKGLRDEKLAPFPRTPYSVQLNRHEYYAMITHLDAQIGNIIFELERTGQMDNTYIIYTADHGLAVGDHGFMGKQNMYDASMRVPFIVVGPNVPEGEQISDLIYLQDAMATSLDLAGSSTKDIDFKSLRPYLEGKKSSPDSREAVYGAYMNLQRSVRDEQYQLIIYPKANVVRFYNLKKDPYALVDLAADKKHIKRMTAMYDKFTALQKEMNDNLDCSAIFNDFIGKLQ